MIWVALPSFGEDIFQTAEHGAVLTAVSIDDGVVVIGFGVLESLIAVVKEDPAGTISSAAKTVVQIVRVVGMLNDRIVDIGAGEMEPSDGLGVLLLELGEISSQIIGILEIPVGVKNVFLRVRAVIGGSRGRRN